MRMISVFLGVTFLFFAGCKADKVKPNVDTKLDVKEIPAQESWKSKILITEKGQTRALLDVGHLRMYTSTQETIIDSGMKVDFYNNFGQKTTTLTSKRGKIDDKTKNLFAYEDVVTVNDSGVVLITEELMWNNSDQKIKTDKFVTITTPTEVLQGYGFESDQHLRNYVIFRITYVTNTDGQK